MDSKQLSLAEHLQRTAPQAREFLHSEAGALFIAALDSHVRDSAYLAMREEDPAKNSHWRAYALAVDGVKAMLEAYAGLVDAEKPAPKPIDFYVPVGDSDPAL